MWIKISTRKEFLAIFQPRGQMELGSVRQTDSVSSIPRGRDELGLVWCEDPRQRWSLPEAVLLDQNKHRDFLAWVLTYLPNFRPFTAYCRVVDFATAENSLRGKPVPSLGKLEEACLGLILGEATTYLIDRYRSELGRLSLIGCTSTYSFAMTRALALGVLNPYTDPVSDTWSAVRDLTKQPKLTLSLETLQEPWAVVLRLAKDGSASRQTVLNKPIDQVMDACLELYKTGDIQPQQWHAVTRGFPEIKNVKEQMRGPLEDRVRTLEKSLAILLTQKGSDRATGAFLCGYLASQVSPGSFDHAPLLTFNIHEFPTALLWYGLCAGLQEGFNLQNYSAGLGRRVLRDVFRRENFLDRPRCDVAVAELKVLTSSESAMVDFPTGGQGHLVVEIAPCVTTLVRWQRRTDLAADTYGTNSQAQLFPTRSEARELRTLFEELEHTLDYAESIRQKLARVLSLYDYPRGKSERKNRKRYGQ